MEITVWSMEMCSLCDEIKGKLKESGINFTEKNVESLTNGEEFNPKAVKQLSDQNFAAPIICIDEKFINPKDFDVDSIKGE